MKYIFILPFLIFACSSPKTPAVKTDNSLKLMKQLEESYYKGDSVNYSATRLIIEENVKHNKKLELSLAYFDASRVMQTGNFKLAKIKSELIFKQAEIFKENYVMFSTSNLLGSIAYFENDFQKALIYWTRCKNIAKKNKFNSELPATLTNIGTAYLALGLYNISSIYFLKAKAEMERLGFKDENYWINHINISNAYLNMNQPEKAIEQLNNTNKNYSSKIHYFYFLNLASAYSDLGQKNKMICYLDSSKQLLSKNKEYSSNYNLVELESYLKYHLKDRLASSIKNYLADSTEKRVSHKCVFNTAYFSIYHRYFDDIKQMVNWKNDLDSTDYLSSYGYHEFMANVYNQTKNTKLECAELRTFTFFQQKLIDEKLKNQLQDYHLIQKNSQIQNQINVLLTNSQLKENQLKKQSIIFILIVLLSILIISVILLLYINAKKSKILNEQMLRNTESKLFETNTVVENLDVQLKSQNQKLKDILLLVNKVQILKKQLDDFFEVADNFQLDGEMQQKFKSAKLDFKSFFSIYNSLTIQASINENLKNSLTKITELNQKELQVAQLAFNDFTTKEISLLLNKSIKSIESIRGEIRRKLQIPLDQNLNAYLKALN